MSFGLLAQYNRIQADPKAKANLDQIIDKNSQKNRFSAGARKEFEDYVKQYHPDGAPSSFKQITDAFEKGYGITDARIGDILYDDAKSRQAQVFNPEDSKFKGSLGSVTSNLFNTTDINPYGLEQADKQQVARAMLGTPKGVTHAALKPVAEDWERHYASIDPGLGILGTLLATGVGFATGNPGLGLFLGSTFGRDGEGVLGSVKGGIKGFGAGGGFGPIFNGTPGGPDGLPSWVGDTVNVGTTSKGVADLARDVLGPEDTVDPPPQDNPYVIPIVPGGGGGQAPYGDNPPQNDPNYPIIVPPVGSTPTDPTAPNLNLPQGDGQLNVNQQGMTNIGSSYLGRRAPIGPQQFKYFDLNNNPFARIG